MPHDDRSLRTIEEAWRLIAAEVRPLATESVPLLRAHGDVLAESIVAAMDLPPFDRAMMDGYAVHAADVAAAPCELHIAGDAPAGAVVEQAVQPGACLRINTGAPMPPGTDAVVPVEWTAPGSAADHVRVERSITVGRHVARRGENRRCGQVVLAAGTRLHAAQIAAAATANVETVTVHRRPRVGIVSTGDEVVELGSALRPGQIIDSNGPMLVALTREAGGRIFTDDDSQPRGWTHVRDEAELLREALIRALRADVVITVGGMSKGTLDLVPDAFERLGARWVFHGVAMRPGKPVAYGVGPDGQHIFGLPGNPVSSLVCFVLFVQMVIDGLQGLPATPPERILATAAEPFLPVRDPRPAYVPARLDFRSPGRQTIRPVPWRGSGDAIGAGRANALAHQPKGDVEIPVGTLLEAIPLAGAFDPVGDDRTPTG